MSLSNCTSYIKESLRVAGELEESLDPPLAGAELLLGTFLSREDLTDFGALFFSGADSFTLGSHLSSTEKGLYSGDSGKSDCEDDASEDMERLERLGISDIPDDCDE